MIFLKTEIHKNIKIKLWLSLLLLCTIASLFNAYHFTSNEATPYLITVVDPRYANAYFVFYRTYFSILGLGFPFIASVLSYSTIVFMEEKQNMMLFHAIRSYYVKLNLAKICTLYLFTSIFVLLAFVSSIIGLKLFLHILPAIYTANKVPNFGLESIWFLKFYICAIGIISLSYLIVLFWPHKKTKFMATILLPYLLFMLPTIINPYAYLYKNAYAAQLIRKNAALETDYNFSSINLITSSEIVSLVYFLLSLLAITYASNKYKFLR